MLLRTMKIIEQEGIYFYSWIHINIKQWLDSWGRKKAYKSFIIILMKKLTAVENKQIWVYRYYFWQFRYSGVICCHRIS